ncbi:MAG: hypothetical protein AAGG44_10795, partial [Planctomycetota bacterium]
ILFATAVILLASHFGWNDIISVLASIPLLMGLAATNSSAAEEKSREKRLRIRCWIYLGQISYAVYLSHLIVQSGYRIFETKFFGTPTITSAWLGFTIRLVIILVGSAALYHIVEVPARNRIRAWLSKNESRTGLIASKPQ